MQRLLPPGFQGQSLVPALSRISLLCVLISGLALAEPMQFDIGAQPLGNALNRLAAQSGLQVIYDGNMVQGKSSRAVSGRQEPQDALGQMLQGSGLTWRATGSGSVMLEKLPEQGGPLELGATTIGGQQLGETTEGTGSYTTAITQTATKLPLSIRETPQSVTVVTRQQMDDHGALAVGDVLRNVPGITQQAYDSDRMEFSARGFAITNYQYDGVNRIYDGVYGEAPTHVDTATFDRIEVIKGSTGLMTGSGDPSATVNLVRKKPTKEFKASVSGTVGSWDNYRSEGDISGPLNDSGSVRGRFVGAYQDRNSYLDHYNQKKDLFYGILEADLTPDTLLTLGIDKQSVTPRGTSWTGTPTYFADGGRTDFSRSFNPGRTGAVAISTP